MLTVAPAFERALHRYKERLSFLVVGERERDRESFAAAATGSEETCCVVVEFGTLVSSSIAKEVRCDAVY